MTPAPLSSQSAAVRPARLFDVTDAEVLAMAKANRVKGPILTREMARASGTDAGNASMRKAGRTQWNDHDFNVAAETTMRFVVLGGFLPPECYEQSVGKPFPFVMGNDGEWIKLRTAA